MRELLSERQFKTLKLYIKIDQSIEDDLLKNFVNDAADQLAVAIKSDVGPQFFLQNDKYCDRFFGALMKMVKDNYDNRGLNLSNLKLVYHDTVDNTINQLRAEVFDANTAHD